LVVVHCWQHIPGDDQCRHIGHSLVTLYDGFVTSHGSCSLPLMGLKGRTGRCFLLGPCLFQLGSVLEQQQWQQPWQQ